MQAMLPLTAQGLTSADRPAALDAIGIDQNLDAQVPLDAQFLDEAGNTVRLGDYLRERPVVLALVYYDCPMLCTEILNGILRAIRVMKLDLGRDFDVVTVSIDPDETPALAAEKKAEYMQKYGRPGAGQGWHALTGSQDSIQKLAQAVGFRYEYDEATDLYIHASSIMVLTPQGHLSRYFFGVEYSPKDLRLGLVEASSGRIGSPIDQILLYCYHYDPATGKYSIAILNVLRLAGLLTVVTIGAFMIVMLKRERRVKARARLGANRESSN